MFRPMRRSRQALDKKECVQILERGTAGVLALLGDEGYPYGVPISYVYADGRLYFHCAKSGHKLDALRRYEKASFCVIDQDEIVQEKFTTYFRSVIAFGKIHEIKDDHQKREAIEKLALKYAPDQSESQRNAEIVREWKPLCLLEMDIEHLSGKEAIELVRARTQSI